MSPIIRVENLTFEYRKTDAEGNEIHAERAIDHIGFQVEAGEFVGILGMNGSGKSTLAKCLNGLLLPSEGDVWIDGMNTRDDDRIWDIRSTVGMVFQNPDNQIVSSVVEDDVAFGPENLGVPPKEIRQRVNQALKQVGMYEQRLKGPHMLSGGQKQRVAIAGALAMHPKCIVFDEPTAMLDPRGRAQVMEIVRELHEEGITVILITHFMEEAMQADRLIVMKDGRIHSDMTPREFFADRERTQSAGLEMPPAIALREEINRLGYPIPADVQTEEELIEAIVQLAN